MYAFCWCNAALNFEKKTKKKQGLKIIQSFKLICLLQSTHCLNKTKTLRALFLPTNNIAYYYNLL
jgi:hypothetical protein